MAEHGIGIHVEITAAVGNYNVSSDGSAAGSARYGRCSYVGKGISVNFTVAGSSSRRLPIQAIQTRQIASVVVFSWAKAFIKALKGRFCII
jgi:hypothetical protein